MSREPEASQITVLDARRGASLVNGFEALQHSLGSLGMETVARLLASAADVTLVVDGEGVIRDVAFGSEELAGEGYRKWVGQPWVETVTAESRPKVEILLREAGSNAAHKGQQVNHISSRGPDVPVLYSTVAAGQDSRLVAFGRDLRPMTVLQQRLMDAQQSMERDYWRLRHAETRYRLLFQILSEAVFIVDAASLKIVEANAAANQLFNETAQRVVGHTFPEGLDAPSTETVQAWLAGIRAVGRGGDVRVRAADGLREFLVSALLFRQENVSLFLVHVSQFQPATAEAEMPKAMLKFMESAPDGLVVTDPAGQIFTANRTFLDLAQLTREEQARGEPLERWLGRPGVDMSVLLSNLRQHGSVRLFSTIVRGENGAIAEVELSAVSIQGEQPGSGFAIRNVGRRLPLDSQAGRETPRSVKQLTELVGRVSLKDLIRESTDLIERLCIEAALELPGDNRAAAAEMLRLSRQSLYVKLRKHGLGDLQV